jgi:hypothetical protein
VLPGVFAVACSTGDGMLNMPEIQAQAKSVAQNALAFLAGAPLAPRAVPGGPKFEAEPWVRHPPPPHHLLRLGRCLLLLLLVHALHRTAASSF